MSDIFVSYSKSDVKDAKSFINELKTEGYEVWWDSNLIPGKAFHDKISKQLEKSKVVIVLWTKSSVKSRWVLSEANRALAHDKLLPILADELDVLDLPAPHDTIHYLRRNSIKEIRDTIRSHGALISGIPWKPIIVDQFERLKKYDVAGNLAMDCDYVVGRFSRAEDWAFEIYFDDKPNDSTFLDTRLSEFYIKCGDVTQWWWGAGDDEDKLPDWHYGWLVFQDLMHGITKIDHLRSGDEKPYILNERVLA